MSFADRLRISRKAMGLSQEQLAEELDVSRQSVTKWETGVTYPELKTLLMLAVKLEKDLDWLLYDEKEVHYGREAARRDGYGWDEIPVTDRASLSRRMEQDLLIEILRAMDGYEIAQRIETEEFAGTRIVTFYKGRAFCEMQGLDPGSDEEISTFFEMSLPQIREVLPLPEGQISRARKLDVSSDRTRT